MSTETTNKKIKIDNGTTFGRTYTDKAIDAKLPTDIIASANKLSLGVGNAPLGNGVNLDGFTYDEKSVTKDSSTGNVVSIGFICTTVRGVGQLILMNTFSVEFTRNNLVSDIVTNTSFMTKSKLFNKKVMTYDSYSPENILPCTASDNGKVLSVVNGEAQWASASGGVTITFED